MAQENSSYSESIGSRMESLVNDFITEENASQYSEFYSRALEFCLRSIGVIERPLTTPKEKESLRNYLDANDIPFREVDTPSDLYSHEHPPLILILKDRDDTLCHISGKYQHLIYSAKANNLVEQISVERLEDKCFEIYAVMPDDGLSILGLTSFVLNGQTWPIVRVSLVSIITVVLYMLLPLFTDPLISWIIPSREVGILIQSSIGFFLILCVSAVSTYLQNIILIRIETVSDMRTQTALWDRLVKLPLKFLGGYSTGDLNSRVDAVTRIRQILSSTIIQAVLNSVFSLIYILIMLTFAPVLTLFLSVGLLLVISIILVLIYFDFRLQLPIYEKEAALTNYSLEMLSCIIPLRVNSCERLALLRWLQSVQSVAQLYMRSKVFNDTSQIAISAYANISIAAVIIYVFFYSSYMPAALLEQSLTWLTAKFLTVLVAYKALITAISNLVSISGTSFAQVFVQWERAKPIFDVKVESGYSVKAKRTSLREAITLDDVSYIYPGSNMPIFKGVSMRFEVGKYSAITGPSGCGKTTLLRIILGLEPPTSGRVLIDNIPLEEISIRTLRREIGVVPQSVSLFNGSLRKNICSGLDYTDEEIWNVLELAKIADEVNDMPMKLETVVTGGGRSFSGGELQRFTIARALISKPKLLIFDEATSALDPNQQQEIINNITKANTSLIAVAHRLSTIKMADKVFELHKYTNEL